MQLVGPSSSHHHSECPDPNSIQAAASEEAAFEQIDAKIHEKQQAVRQRRWHTGSESERAREIEKDKQRESEYER